MMTTPAATISVVSHGQMHLVHDLLLDLDRCCASDIEVLLTVNVKEPLVFDAAHFRFPVTIIENTLPQGFGANHNAAAKQASAPFFCVLNPDIRLRLDPFPRLLAMLKDERVAAVAPRIVTAEGEVEDSARHFPTFLSILRKALGGRDTTILRIFPDTVFSPDWIAGMFMVLPTALFRAFGGFDERYYLYYEDVDLCARLRMSGYDIRVVPDVSAIHLARRESHRNVRYLVWHIRSLVRFLCTTGRARKSVSNASH